MIPELDYETTERLAAELCAINGGDWGKRKTHRNVWRKRVMALWALAHGDHDEARRVMQ